MGEREGLSAKEFEKLLSDGITLVAPGDQDRYLGKGGSLQGTVQRAARSLRELKLVSPRPQITDCLPPHE